MKLAQTILSKLRRSDLFVENRSAQALQLRRSGIFRRRADVAPTELEIFLDALATKIPRLRRWEMATFLSKLKACNHSAQRCAERATLGYRAQIFSTLKGLHPFSRVRLAPLQGAENILDFHPGYRFAQPWAEYLQPFGLPETAHALRAGRR
jgi:hypothetical protein